jgi:hypothetical protein
MNRHGYFLQKKLVCDLLSKAAELTVKNIAIFYVSSWCHVMLNTFRILMHLINELITDYYSIKQSCLCTFLFML